MIDQQKSSQEIDEERIVQTHSNLGLVDARPGESTFPTGTKNHSTSMDHAFDELADLPAEEELEMDEDSELENEEE
ncbi:hypothetical protein [Arundinibacter roseus]|uniref:Uncharacterized protein n=1 Tax=Arundinibacter roseus TaxID=2070510 RepID=A0A4R4KMV6_9BACT|nr:hypothetical protein [Arundinibacter roseus]TDB67861.1 hypothetical protein EZE20_02750 [Arundinibacter roseus]